jgi:RNA polymerase sigma-70 factor (ECF subfamily)
VLLPNLGDAQAAEDALSETFRALLEHLPELRADETSLWPWLCRVGRNKAIDMHRARTRTRRALVGFEGLLAPLQAGSDVGAELETLDGRTRLRAKVAGVLGLLSERYRRAIELRFLEDRSREQCAALMQLKLGTFDVLLLRALRAFRRQWQALQSSERDVG